MGGDGGGPGSGRGGDPRAAQGPGRRRAAGPAHGPGGPADRGGARGPLPRRPRVGARGPEQRAFLEDPPLTDAAHRGAGKAVARQVASDLDRLRQAADEAQNVMGTASADAALREVRKCAERLRYAAESAAAIHGKRARRLAKEAASLQETLSEHGDSVVTRRLLRELSNTAFLEGANAFSFGRLHAREQHRGAEARAQFSHDWKRFKPKPLRED